MEGTQLITVLNPFKHFEREIETIDVHGKDLSVIRRDYLPEDIFFSLAVNGQVYTEEQWPFVQVKNGDSIVCVPKLGYAEGAAATAAAVTGATVSTAAAATATGVAIGTAITTLSMALAAGAWTWIAVYAISYIVYSVIGGILINALMSAFNSDPAKSGSDAGSDFDRSQTYSWNPATTQRPGSVIPKVYGRLRLHGNIIAVSSESKTGTIEGSTDSYLNVLISLGYGPIAGISSVQISDQPIEQLTNVGISARLGYLKQPVISYFNDTKVEKAVSINITYSTLAEGYVYTTEEGQEFDGIEVDITFPSGIFYMANDGKMYGHSIGVRVEIRKKGDTEWTQLTNPVASTEPVYRIDYDSRWGLGRGCWAANYSALGMLASAYGISATTQAAKYVRVEIDPDTICTALNITYADLVSGSFLSFVAEYNEWSEQQIPIYTIVGPTPGNSPIPGLVSPVEWLTQYEWKYDTKHVIEDTSPYIGEDAPYQEFADNATASKTVTLKSRTDLPRGQYDIRITKMTADITSSSYGDLVKLTAVRTVTADDFSYPREAVVGINALATGQLSGSFDFSGLVDGSFVRVYDGSKWVVAYTNNPAWVCYDVITQPVFNDPSLVSFNGSTYRCKLSHLSSAANKPGSGANWVTYWHLTDSDTTADAWVIDTSYVDLTDSGVDRYEGYDPSRIDYLSFKVWADWCDAKVYKSEGNVVTGTDSKKYGCTVAHTSSSSNKPITGVDWALYWAETLADATSVWTEGVSYVVAMEARYAFNGVFDSEFNLWDAASKVASMARASLIWNGYQVTVVVDKAETAVQLFSSGNIIIDSFEEIFLPLDDRASEIEVSFLNSAKNYDRDVCSIYNTAIESVSNKVSTQSLGTTSASQAWRIGQYLLLCNQYLTRTIKFNADVDAIACSVGDVINFQHDVPRWGLAGGRLVSATPTTVTLDKEVSVSAGTYSVMVRISSTDDSGKDLIVTKDIIITEDDTTDTFTVSSPFSVTPAQYDLYAFGVQNIEVKPFRVIDIEHSQDQTFTIRAIEYDENVYSVDLDTPIVPTIDYTEKEYLLPVTDLSLSEYNYLDTSGNLVNNIRVTFSKPTGYVYRKAIIKYRFDGSDVYGVWEVAGETDGESFLIRNVQALSSYEVVVQSVSQIGELLPEGQCVRETITTTNSYGNGTFTLGSITGLQIFGQGNGVYFEGKDCKIVWNAITVAGTDSSAGNETQGAGSSLPPTWLKDYEVSVYSALGTLRRTEYTNETTYIYSFEKNSEDGGGIPVGSFRVSVSARDLLGRVSNLPSSITVTNSDPDDVGTIIGATVVGGVSFSWSKNDDTDLDTYLYRVKVETDSYPAIWSESADNKVLCALSSAQIIVFGSRATIYIEVKAKDVFGNVSATASSSSAVANSASDNLFQLIASSDGVGTPASLYDGNTTSGGILI